MLHASEKSTESNGTNQRQPNKARVSLETYIMKMKLLITWKFVKDFSMSNCFNHFLTLLLKCTRYITQAGIISHVLYPAADDWILSFSPRCHIKENWIFEFLRQTNWSRLLPSPCQCSVYISESRVYMLLIFKKLVACYQRLTVRAAALPIQIYQR